MQHETAPDWHAREVAQLQSEVDLLSALLEPITLIGKPHEALQGPRVVPPTAEGHATGGGCCTRGKRCT